MKTGGCWSWAGRRGVVCVVLAFGMLLSSEVRGQSDGIEDYFDLVFPEATRFGPVEGAPPVYPAYRTDPASGVESLAGFIFLTSDIPPETVGYSGPIEVLVGMDLTGTLTGVRVIDYRESLRRSRGDFLGRSGVQSQFDGKSILDPFRVRQDIDGVTGATLSSNAMATGIRNAARRVAAAYITRARYESGPLPHLGSISIEELDRLTWPEIVALDMAKEISGDVGSSDLLRMTFAYLRDETFAEAIVGSTRWPRAAGTISEAPDRHMIFVGMNGPNVIGYNPEYISFVQDGDTLHVTRADFVSTGLLPNGMAGGVFRRTGILLVGRELDVRRPFTVQVGSPDELIATGEYVAFDPPAPVVADAPEPDAEVNESESADPAAISPGDAETTVTNEPIETAPSEPTAEGPSVEVAVASPQAEAIQQTRAFEFPEDGFAELLLEEEAEDTSVLAQTLAFTSWPRVIGMLLLLALVTQAFRAKRPGLRWVALAGTIAFLGFVDRGFLSVSHILSAITVGPEVFLRDLSLLLLAAFTVVTTLLWGRIFCGFLCPFGALQDVLDKIVPKRIRREFSRPVHERALYAKYGILVLVLAPAILSAPFTLYHYFEPFGTVFYWSPSPLLWSIAIGILVASAIVPRFYCRYMCPLGAALAIGSLLSPFRIRRVEQCTICTVCERKCPTGAIEKERVNFKECVRCNECETQLIEKAGVCKHDMDVVRARLVHLPVVGAQEGSAV